MLKFVIQRISFKKMALCYEQTSPLGVPTPSGNQKQGQTLLLLSLSLLHYFSPPHKELFKKSVDFLAAAT